MSEKKTITSVIFTKLFIGSVALSSMLTALSDMLSPLVPANAVLLAFSAGLLVYYSYLGLKYPDVEQLVASGRGFSNVNAVREIYEKSWRAGIVLAAAVLTAISAAGIFVGERRATDNGIPIYSPDDVAEKAKSLRGVAKESFLEGIARGQWELSREGKFSGEHFRALFEGVPPGSAATRTIFAIWGGTCEKNTLDLEIFSNIVGSESHYFNYGNGTIINTLYTSGCLKTPFSAKDLASIFRKDGNGLVEVLDYRFRESICREPLDVKDLPAEADPRHVSWVWKKLIEVGERANCLTEAASKVLMQRHEHNNPAGRTSR